MAEVTISNYQTLKTFCSYTPIFLHSIISLVQLRFFIDLNSTEVRQLVNMNSMLITAIIQCSKRLDMKFARPDECGLYLELAVLLLPYSVGQSSSRALSDSRGQKT